MPEGSLSSATPESKRVSQSRRPDIQGLRAIAILVVVCFHSGILFPTGFIGVDVFFAISGYVIFGLLARNFESQTFSLSGFYRARIRRLAPAVGLLLVVVLLISIPLLSPIDSQRDTAVIAVGGATWTANVPLLFAFGGYFDPQADTNPLLHLWSLAVEEQFYLVIPIIVWVAWLKKGLRGMLLASGCVFLLSATLLALLKTGLVSPPRALQVAFFSSPTRAWEFAAGGIAYILAVRKIGPKNSAAIRFVALLGMSCIILSAFWIGDQDKHPSWPVAIPVLGTCLVLVAGSANPANLVSRALSVRPLTWLGDLSYSWYLWHWPLIVFAVLILRNDAVLPAVGVVALLPAFLSYKYVETPVRTGVSLANWHGGRVLALTSLPAIVLAAVLGFGWWNSWWSPAVRGFADQVKPLPLGFDEGCQTAQTFNLAQVKSCTWGAERSGPPVYLFGDSNAGMYSDGLALAAERLQRPMILLTSPGCEPVALSVDRGQDTRCYAYVQAALDFLRNAPRGAVVMASANGNVLPPDATASQEAWSEALASAIDSIQSSGHSVVYMQQIPQFRVEALHQWWHPGMCPLLRVQWQTSSCGETVTLAETIRFGGPARAAEEDGLRLAGIDPVPTVPELCTGSICRTNSGDYWAYRDGLHISVQQSVRFEPILERAVSSATPSP